MAVYNTGAVGEHVITGLCMAMFDLPLSLCNTEVAQKERERERKRESPKICSCLCTCVYGGVVTVCVAIYVCLFFLLSLNMSMRSRSRCALAKVREALQDLLPLSPLEINTAERRLRCRSSMIVRDY